MRKKVAIVEDNPDNRELVRSILEDSYDVSEYDTGQQAIEGFRRERPDLMLLESGRSTLLPRLSQPFQQLFDTQPVFQRGLMEQFTTVQNIGQPAFATGQSQQPAADLLPRDQRRNHLHEAFVKPKAAVEGESFQPVVPTRLILRQSSQLIACHTQ